ncbi:substrate-binding domain-containing protein [Dehalogenimonas sp. THU2]|jgi:tungstate transport system substrate-binding protein|uniref:substrate-binding domain-containing protein n=1 Tax=Dehalogenimonas sp. THU2 TaxID=3151121 RepID=UPI003218A484
MKKFWSKLAAVMFSLMLISFAAIGCGTETPNPDPTATDDEGLSVLDPSIRLRVSTTTSLYDTGLWALLEPMFEKKYGVEVDVMSNGTGIALEFGKRGDVDIVVVHSKSQEEAFIAGGFGTQRYVFASNYFVIVGPANDPLGLKGLSPEAAFKKLADSGTAKFVSRGDNSGTHAKEKAIWAAAGFNYETVRTSGSWYIDASGGMGATLLKAKEFGAYTIADIGTFLAYKADTGLTIAVDQGAILLNVYAAIPVNPANVPGVRNAEAAKIMAEWLMSKEIQDIIGQYGVKDYGAPLFNPTYGVEPTS